ncbi:class I SAM-dependent methyltransferase [Candidatus Woesearchaeota archaeon]|nr:class I SAM-dependent methyltransferase [Candidatus Woesearchaeota archaeon]
MKDKNVLDVGSVSHDAKQETSSGWLFIKLLEHAKHVLGVDYETKQVNILRKKGYNIIAGDATKIKLGKSFDVVVAGDIIEHINDQGAFLKNMHAHLKRRGKIIICTPNADGFGASLRRILFGGARTNPDHVLWHDKITLRVILERYGFTVENVFYSQYIEGFSALPNKIFGFFRASWAPCLIVVAKKK